MTAFISILFWIMVAAAAFHAAYASVITSPLIVLYLFALLRLAQTDRWRKAFYSGLAVGLLIAAVRLGFFWTLFSGAAVTLWIIYAFWIGVFVALARSCLERLGPKWGWLLIPFLWTGLEYFRSELYYLRFSWLNVGYAFAGTPWQGALRLVGTYGVGFLFVSLAAVAALLWHKSRIQASAILAAGAAGICLGGLSIGNEPPTPVAARVHVAGIQLEFPSEKEVLFRLKDVIHAHPDTELVVLSECTFDGPVPAAVKAWCRDNRRYLVVGGKDPAPAASFYNTAYVVGPGGDIVFRQVKAVPIQFFKDGLRAPEQKLWNSPWGKIGICVCYDLSYTRVTDRLVTLGAEAIIVPTMDMAEWGRAQHEMHARIAPVRATEYGLPLFRLASSGISQLVDRTGCVMATAPCLRDGAMLAGTLEMRGCGSRPLDRWLAPFSTALTAAMMAWFLIRRGPGNRPPAGAECRNVLIASRAEPQPDCAKRLECAELAPAIEPRLASDSASKLDALQTLRAIWLRFRLGNS